MKRSKIHERAAWKAVHSKSPFGAHKGAVIYMGDIMSPIDDEWTADEENVFAPGGPQEVEIVYFDLDAIMRRLEAE